MTGPIHLYWLTVLRTSAVDCFGSWCVRVPSKGLPWDKGSYLSPGYTPSTMTACTQRLDNMDKNLGLLPQFGTTLKGNPSSGASSGIPSSQSCFPHSIRSVLTKIISTTLPPSARKSSFQALILENAMQGNRC